MSENFKNQDLNEIAQQVSPSNPTHPASILTCTTHPLLRPPKPTNIHPAQAERDLNTNAAKTGHSAESGKGNTTGQGGQGSGVSGPAGGQSSGASDSTLVRFPSLPPSFPRTLLSG